jgi:hypothetical protein
MLQLFPKFVPQRPKPHVQNAVNKPKPNPVPVVKVPPNANAIHYLLIK